MERLEGLELIKETVVDCLDVDPEEVQPESRLIDDLGADSLDFIDIIFNLEKAFEVRLREGDLDFLSRLDLSNPEVAQAGYLTETAMKDLSPWLPQLKDATEPVGVGKAFSMITIETLWLVVDEAQKLAKAS